jgi:hypothetical protein
MARGPVVEGVARAVAGLMEKAAEGGLMEREGVVDIMRGRS